jgi:WD40 repeat protein
MAIQLVLFNLISPGSFSQGIDDMNESLVILNKDVIDNSNNLHWVNSLQILDKIPYIIGEYNGLRLWRKEDGSVESLISLRPDDYICRFVVSHDESKVVACIENYVKKEFFLVCYSLSDKKQLWKTDSANFRNGLGISSDDNAVNAKTGQIIGKRRMFLKYYWFPNAGGVEVKFSQNGEYALFWKNPFSKFSFHSGQRLRVWNMNTNKLFASKLIAGQDVMNACFIKDGKSILTGNYDGSLRLWSTTNNVVDSIWKINRIPIKDKTIPLMIDLLIIPYLSVDYVAIRSKYNGEWALKIFSYPKMKLTGLLLKPGYNSSAWSGAFSDYGDHLVVCDKGFLCLYNTSNWRLVWRVLI